MTASPVVVVGPGGERVDVLLAAASLAGLLSSGEDAPSSSRAVPVFAPIEVRVVPDDDLCVTVPLQGHLFDIVDGVAARGSGGRRPRLGLLVPVVWVAPGPAPALVIVADHVDLALRAPLAGRRQDGGAQTFPSLTGIYQPAPAAAADPTRVYSEVAVAGVADAGRLTPFERRELAAGGWPAVSDRLVDAVVVAAYHGIEVLACGVPAGETRD